MGVPSIHPSIHPWSPCRKLFNSDSVSRVWEFHPSIILECNLSNSNSVSRVWELHPSIHDLPDAIFLIPTLSLGYGNYAFFLRDPPITLSDLHRLFSGSRDLHAASRSRNSTSFHAAPDLSFAASSISGSSPYSTIFLARPDAPGRDLSLYNASPLLWILACFC
jgi:hypothetical protein